MTVAALSNGVRVALIGTLAYFDIGSPLHGPFHVLHGLFVAGVGYAALLVGFQLLSRGRSSGPADRDKQQVQTESVRPFRIARLEALGLTAAFVVAGAVVAAPVSRPIALAASLDELPFRLGEWESDPFPRAHAPIAEPWATTADQHLRRRYRSADGLSVDVYVGYFESQYQGKEVVNFGSIDLHRRAVRHSVPSGATPLDANLIRDAGNGATALFWYELDGLTETTASRAKLRTLWNALAARRNNAAVVVLTTDPRSGTPEDAAEKMASLVPLIHGSLARLLPLENRR
jgi:EpsI family protein